jgi:hypothetical protein
LLCLLCLLTPSFFLFRFSLLPAVDVS